MAAEAFGHRPSAMLGILDEAAALDFDLAAWGVLQARDREREAWEAYREREGRREMAYMVGLVRAGREIPATPRPGIADAPESGPPTVRPSPQGCSHPPPHDRLLEGEVKCRLCGAVGN